MLFGHNTNVTLGQTVYHVQTEDRGITNALIDTTVHCRGRVLHRRTNSYFDLLPLDADRAQALKLRLDEQHRTVLEEVRSGALQLAPPPVPAAPYVPPAAVPKPPAIQASAPSGAIALELVNARSWLAGKHASLQIAVRKKDGGAAVAGARVAARVDGAAERVECSAETGAQGQVQLEFDMPRLASEEPALVIEAVHGEVHSHLRFQLRAKPKVPTAG
jgi:hypothetical protein